MEAKELMIGDWAQSPDLKRPAQYSGRFLDFQPLDGEKYRRLEFLYEDGNCGMHIPEKRVNPITLTEEILEKNGFTDVGDYFYQNEKQCCGVDLSTFMFYIYENDYDNDNCHDVAQVFYVHQLQHALRLVGLDNVADNLKV